MELRVWVSPIHNPFVGQARRAAARGQTLWRVPIVMACLWALPMLIDWLASFDNERDLANDGALFWIGIALFVAFIGRLLRCEALLRIEIIKGRFEPLQLMPIPAARRAWLWCAPATLFALLTCALAVPALMWGLGGGLFTLSDAIGLALLALMLSWGRPLWRPKMWRGQIAKNNADAANRSDGFEAPPAPPGDGALWLACGAVVGLTVLIAGAGSAAPLAYWEGLPAYLRATGDEFWMTWPLFMARWLMRAQPFFGMGLAPIFLVLPAWVAGVIVGVTRLGAVTALEPYWTEPRLELWHRARKVRSAAGTILVFGLLWPGSVNSAWMGVWFAGTPATRETALAAWWIAALAMASLGASALWWRALNMAPARVTLVAHLKSAARVAARGVALVAALFLIVHIVGLAWPFGAFWRHIAPASLAVALVFGGAHAVTWGGMRAPQLQRSFGRWHLLWLCGGPVAYVVPNFIDFDISQFLPTIFFVSPWTLWLALRDADIGANPTFWLAIAVHFGLIAATALVMWRARDTPIEPDASQSRENAAPAKSVAAEMLKPTPTKPIAISEKDDERAKTANDAGKTGNDDDKTDNYDSKTGNDASKTGNDASKTGNDVDKTGNDGSKTGNDVGKTDNDGGKTDNDGGRTDNEGAKAADASLRETDASLRETDASLRAADAPLRVADAGVRDDDDDEEGDDDDDEDDDVADKVNAMLRRAPLEAPQGHLQSLLLWLERFDNPLLLLETRRVIGNAVSNTLFTAWIANGIALLVFLLVLPLVALYNGIPFADILPIPLSLMLIIWWAMPLLGIDGASRAYDNDRLDGSLQALFLTPRTESEIAWGKLGPFVVRGALMLILFAPMWALGLLFCFYLSKPLLTAAYGAMPFFAASFTLRSAMVSHWMALVKRRVGSSGVPTSLALCALIALPAEAGVLIWGGGTGALALFGAALLLSGVFVIEAWLMWRLGLRALRRWRGKGAPGSD